MIASYKELRFYIMADRMMNRGYFTPPLLKRFVHFVRPDYIILYLYHMRCYSYYVNSKRGAFKKVLSYYHKYFFLKYGLKCGYSIGADCFGYGLTLLHYGTIVIGSDNRIGNYSIIFPSTCIVQNASTIGESFFMGHGSIISKRVVLGDNVSLAAGSVLNHSYSAGNVTLAGSPASAKKQSEAWYLGAWDNSLWKERVKMVEKLKADIGI